MLNGERFEEAIARNPETPTGPKPSGRTVPNRFRIFVRLGNDDTIRVQRDRAFRGMVRRGGFSPSGDRSRERGGPLNKHFQPTGLPQAHAILVNYVGEACGRI